jgi:4-hydroxyphenylpyruvate dioxygenase
MNNDLLYLCPNIQNEETDYTLRRNRRFPELKGFDFIELYVGNAYQAAHYFRSAWGFKLAARAGPETGVRDRVSILLEQNQIRLLLTAALGPDSPIARHVDIHGDSVKDVAFLVDDVEEVFEQVVAQGAKPVSDPTLLQDDYGSVIKATIEAYGDTVHSFVQRDAYHGPFMSGYQKLADRETGNRIGLQEVDHVAVCAEPGRLDELVEFYRDVFGFHQSHHEDVASEYSGMNSKVVQSGTGRIKFPIVEPATGKRRSQIHEFLSYHYGPGVQHIAMRTDDIVSSVRSLRDNDIEFLRTPDTYYELLEHRVGKTDLDQQAIRELEILVDRDEWGYLMQIFSKPLQSRPTIFFEVIQRRAARGFGGGNIKALFEALEREQAQRGNL